MARFSGKAGSVSGASNTAITSFDIDAQADAIDVTGMDDAGIKEFLAGLTSWSGSFEGHATGNPSAMAPGTTLSACQFASSATNGAPKLTGTCIVTSLKVSTSVEGSVKVSVGFQGTGALTYGVV